MRTLIVILALALPAASCASGPRFLAPDDTPQTAYGAFLSARYAAQMRDIGASAAYYDAAYAHEPDMALVADRAFSTALMAGDFARADRLAADAAREGAAGGVASLYDRAAQLAGGRTAVADATPYGPFGELIAIILEDWEQVRRGRVSAAIDTASTRDLPMGSAGYLLLHQALLLEAGGVFDRAEDAYRAADTTLGLRDYTTVLLGEFLERRGRHDDAAGLYQRQIARSGGDGDPELLAALARVQARGRPPRFPAAPHAAARAIHGPAVLLMARAPVEFPVLYLRLAQRLDPGFARNTLATADALQSLGLTTAARRAYGTVDVGPFAERAAISGAWLDFEAGRTEAAVRRARAIGGSSASPGLRMLLANLLQASGDCEGAEALYTSLMEEAEAAGDPADWRHAYFAGSCKLSRAGWDVAAPLMLRALELAPDQPAVLNDVGYSLIVEGGEVERGLDMVQRAAAMEPENPAFLDSVGWGFYRAGYPDVAVDWLERAIERAPGNPVIAWHLGDVYAATGRELEAGFQWRRALELDPAPELAALIERRLSLGLAAGPVEAS
jgi:tetratricopeptide (TPR) repeat protein